MKKKKLLQKVFIITIILFFVFISTNLLKTTVQGASNKPVKSYITITVKANDNLWNISQLYMNDNYYDINNYIEEVMVINSLKDSQIYVNDKLTLPIVN